MCLTTFWDRGGCRIIEVLDYQVTLSIVWYAGYFSDYGQIWEDVGLSSDS